MLKLLSCPITILTLGFFVFVINGISLWLASAIADKWFHVGFYVDGFWAALIMIIVSVILTVLIRSEVGIETRGPMRTNGARAG